MPPSLSAALALSAALLLSATASAQPASAATTPAPPPATTPPPATEAAKNAARALAETGKQKLDAGDYAGALEALQDAEKYHHAPTITRVRALAHEKLGQLKLARQLCEQVAGEALPPGAPTAFTLAQQECAKTAAALDRRIPRVRIDLQNAPPGTRVTLDGRELDEVARANRIRLDPGKHTVVVQAPGGEPVSRELHVAEGGVKRVLFDLSPSAAEPSRVSNEEATTGTGVRLGPAIAFGIGGAGLVAGAIAGAMTLARAAEIRDLCGGDSACPESQRARIDLEGAKGVGYVSTAGFALAGVGAVVGVVLLLIPRETSETSARAVGLDGAARGPTTPQRAAHAPLPRDARRAVPRDVRQSLPRLQATLGPTFAGVKGTF